MAMSVGQRAAGGADANPFGYSAAQLHAADDIFRRGAHFSGTGANNPQEYANMLGGSINSFLNPYYNEVIDATLGRIEDQRRVQTQYVGDQAKAAGAFGGARHGLVEAGVNEEAMRQGSEITSSLMAQGFNQARQSAFQAEQQRLAALRQQMGAGGMLQGLGGMNYNLGTDMVSRQGQQGDAQQRLLQAILSGAEGQFQGLVNSPTDMLTLVSSMLGADPRQAAVTTSGSKTVQPGTLDYLGLGLQTGAKIATAPMTGGGSLLGSKK